MTMPDVSGLPTNLDATYSDDAANPSRKSHQQHHDLVHEAVQAAKVDLEAKLDTATATATFAQVINVLGHGAVGDGTTDDTAALQAALDAAQALGGSDEGPRAKVFAPAGRRFRTSSPLTISSPIAVEFLSFIEYTGSTGSALVVGATAPVASRNTGYDLNFVGFRQIGGNGAVPGSVNAAGACGVEVRNMQFSKLRVGKLIAFTKAGLYLNSTNTTYVGQHVQDNRISVGEVAYNGYGILALSVSAADGSVQVNRIDVDNCFANYIGAQFDDATYAGNTNNNIIEFLALDDNAAATDLVINGVYNDVRLGYLFGTVQCGTASFYNKVYVQNNIASGAVLSDLGSRNWMTTSAPDTATLPASVSITAGAAVQNNYGVPIAVTFAVQMLASTTNPASVDVKVGASATPGIVSQLEVPSDAAPGAFKMPVFFVVPPGHYWQIDRTVPAGGAVNFTGAAIYRASA